METKEVQLKAVEKRIPVKEGFKTEIIAYLLEEIPELYLAKCDYGDSNAKGIWFVPANQFDQAIESVKKQIIKEHEELFIGL